jgi:osmotically-inducible protein OsmY
VKASDKSRLQGPKRGIPPFINVKTRNGAVYLYGRITNKEKIGRAIQIVRGINGVTGVEYKFTKLFPIAKKSITNKIF